MIYFDFFFFRLSVRFSYLKLRILFNFELFFLKFIPCLTGNYSFIIINFLIFFIILLTILPQISLEFNRFSFKT